jgi:hypothetical protein
MRTFHILVFAGALALAGCNHDDGGNGGNGGNGGSGGGVVDMAMGGDMTDPGTPPTPTATHVGVTGNTSNLVTDGAGHAAYLVNAAPVMSGTTALGIAGELHVTDAGGKDTMLAANVFQHCYQLAPDGSAIFWIGFDATNGPKMGTASLNFLSLTAAGAMPKQLVATGMPVTNVNANNPAAAALYAPNPLTQESLFSPSGKYFLVGIAVAIASTTPDLHVFDTTSGMDVYQRPNGGFVYLQLVMPDDTLIFQDTAAGSGPSAPPVQTLYWVALPGTTAATAITTHTASFQPSADGKTLVILKTGGDLLTWDMTAKSGAPKTLAAGAALFTVGGAANGPVAWVGGDQSVHVVGLDGGKLLDLDAASAAADVFGGIHLSPDAAHVYWFASAEQQNNRGQLRHAEVKSGATVATVADKVSVPDFTVTDSAIVFLRNVDDLGKLGDAAWAGLDGATITALGMKANVGGLRVGVPGSGSWAALHLNAAAADTGHNAIDGAPSLTGALALGSGSGDAALDPTVHAGGYRMSDSGKIAVFAGGATWNATASNWAGALSFVSVAAPSMIVDGHLAGVTELGTIAARKLFVCAPGATPAGIYFVAY